MPGWSMFWTEIGVVMALIDQKESIPQLHLGLCGAIITIQGNSLGVDGYTGGIPVSF